MALRVGWRVALVCLALSVILSVSTAGATEALAPHEAGSFLANSPQAYILDVRTPEEQAAGVLQGAHLIPIAELEARAAELPADRPIVIYCAAGRRAKRAVDLLQRVRPELQHVYYINGAPRFDK